MILIHGRGASAADIMTVAAELMHPGFAYLAPQAAGGAWYPNPFTAPLADNEPYLSSALEVVASLVATIERTVDLPQPGDREELLFDCRHTLHVRTWSSNELVRPRPICWPHRPDFGR